MGNIRQIFAFLCGFIRPPLRNMLIAVSLLGLAEIFFAVRIPFVNADIINSLVDARWDAFKYWGAVLLLLFAGQLLVGFCNKYLLLLFNENMEKNIRNGVFEYVAVQHVSFTETRSTGDILSRMLNDTPKIKGFITGIALQCCFDAVAIVIAFCILVQRSWLLSLIVFAFAPLAVGVGSFFKRKLADTTREVQEKVAVFTSGAQTWVSRLQGVKIYGMERVSVQQFEKNSLQYTRATIQSGKWNILMSVVNALFLSAPSILILVTGGYYCLQGRLSIGELFAFLTFSTYFIAPLQRVIALINVELPKMYPIYERFKDFGMTNGKKSIRHPSLPETELLPDAAHLSLVIENMEYEKNGFRLSVPRLAFRTGQLYGICGANGSGKSTLAKILKGVLLPVSGTIGFAGHTKIKSEAQTYLLSQDAFFFDGSLQENVTLFERNGNTEKYREIIRRLDLEKYEALFSQNGNAERSRMLSGGELQKVNIARLMYSNRLVLILDEPDSFTDAATKNILKEWIMEAKQGRIIIVITHDKELLDICDTVYRLEQIEPKHSIIRA